jgi:hypothetical protein
MGRKGRMKKLLQRIEQFNGVVTYYYSDGTYKERSIVNIPDRIRYLEEQHKRLHTEINAIEKKNPYADELKDRKRDKLIIKDEITRLTAQYESDSGVENFA